MNSPARIALKLVGFFTSNKKRSMTKPNRSKAIRKLKSATNSTLRINGNVSSKGLSKTAKWLISDNKNAIESSRMMELEQKVNFIQSHTKNHLGIFGF
jgi:hypothetical protein